MGEKGGRLRERRRKKKKRWKKRELRLEYEGYEVDRKAGNEELTGKTDI